MAVRHRLRRQLRSLASFLDPLSAAAILPAAPVEALREAEAALQVWRVWRGTAQCSCAGALQLLDHHVADALPTPQPADAAAVAAV